MTYDHWKTTPDHDPADQDEPPDCCPDCGAEGHCAPGCPSRCTCRLESVNSASIDPPELITDPWCPAHGGRDPDDELQRQRDDADWDRQYGLQTWEDEF